MLHSTLLVVNELQPESINNIYSVRGSDMQADTHGGVPAKLLLKLIINTLNPTNL